VSTSHKRASPERRNKIRKNTYRVYDGINLPYSDDSFDAASAVCVFHHVPVAARTALAKEVRRVLRRGGLFAIFEHNPLNPLTRHVVNRCEFDRNAILLRANNAEKLLEDAGFHDVDTRFILTIPTRGFLLRAADCSDTDGRSVSHSGPCIVYAMPD
jgi:SAM-dependent methyltransferase